MPQTPTDPRPPVAIGHVIHRVNEVRPATAHLVALGMRSIVEKDEFAVLELRGGTHLVVLPAEEPVAAGTRASFDLIVDDIEAAREEYARKGLAPSDLVRGDIHTSFVVVDPSGYEITINSTHASDQPI